MKIQAASILLFLTLFACSQGTKLTVRPQEVLGVRLGGSVEELKTVYKENWLSLQRIGKDKYVSASIADPLEGLLASGVSYQVSSGVLQVVEVSFKGDVSNELEALLDEEHSTDPSLRQQLEQKQRFIGTIGENDHYWLLPDMGVMVIVKKEETRLLYRLK